MGEIVADRVIESLDYLKQYKKGEHQVLSEVTGPAGTSAAHYLILDLVCPSYKQIKTVTNNFNFVSQGSSVSSIYKLLKWRTAQC